MSELKRRTPSEKTTLDKNAKEVLNAKKAKSANEPSRLNTLRLMSRVVVIFSLMTIIYLTYGDEKFKSLAKQSELITMRSQEVECSESYLKDINNFEGCLPEKCGRFVFDKLITETEVDKMLSLAKKGLSVGQPAGGAAILDLHSGALSYGKGFVNIYKKEEFKDIFSTSDFDIYKIVKAKIHYAVSHNFGIDMNKIYLTHPTFFSELTSVEPTTIHDEYWHSHVDQETYEAFHYTALLYLNNYNEDFTGGRFVFVDAKVNRTIEPRKGRVSTFTSGPENVHYVERVTNGTRYAITVSFTCNPKYAIQDPQIPNKI